MKKSERKHRVKMEIVTGDPKSQKKSLRFDVIGNEDYDRLFSTKISAEMNNPTTRIVFGLWNNIWKRGF